MNAAARLASVLAFALGLVSAPGAVAAAQHDELPRRTAPWPPRAVELAEALPVQDGGRIKPLRTYASFTLLRFHGKSSLETAEGEKLEALPWLLDVLLYPQQAADYPVFKVDDIDAITSIGLTIEGKKKRDRYSLNELKPGIGRLFELAREYGRKEEKSRATVEQQVYTLATSVDDYIRLHSHLDYARWSQDVSDSPALMEVFGGDEAPFSQVIAKMPELLVLQATWRSDKAHAADASALTRVLQTASELTEGTGLLALIPPAGTLAVEPAWHSPEDLFMHAIQSDGVAPAYVEALQRFEALARSVAEPAKLEPALAALHDRTVTAATARGEYGKIGLELTYYKSDLIANSLVVYILGFVLCAVLWMVPRSRLLYRASALAAVAATGLLVAAIVIRCTIRERPPVSTLYETLLFVTAVGSILLLVTEWISRQRIALSVNTALGMIGLFLANGYETLDKKDTMPQLVAVLDTNFWLATHVTAITVGYAAGMVAAAISSVWLLARLFRIRQKDPAFGKNLIRMAYGALCFGLIFSVVGTILGGIWANESWGRFWGWDPKENGAMLICLAQIAILHGRMGGFLRDFGIAAATAFQGTVIAFSWFGVNLLGVGLHSYGFTSGIHTALWSYYVFQWGLIAVCGVQHYLQRTREQAVKDAARAAGGSTVARATQSPAD
jgi:ABC-type transport system involved in cytochrome c biogenesis permease subunit